jgi:XRE family transcriptional regulator, regulator of sulfur utilization
MTREMPSSNLRAALAEQIRLFRSKKGLSQEELAFRAGLHRTYISLIERGKKSPTIDCLVRVSGALDVRISDLLANAERYAKGQRR